ncbi:MAG: CRISPR system precrRNA processing endoribonuclease RAMP protein Cas6 [Mariprofundales bacterium]|nr:CRISPR system precrRNA processing endoribonuclease RAMP protein Cas6 [Mariprofundales bacterium]
MPLEIVPLRIRFSYPTDHRPRGYSGSAWRGGFGHALKRLVCLFSKGACGNCPLATQCAYTTVFEPAIARPDAPREPAPPYTLYPVADDHGLWLNVTLFGEAARRHRTFVLQALRQAGELGIGDIHYRFEGIQSRHGDGWVNLEDHPMALSTPPAAPDGAIRLQLLTPLRFKYEGHLIRPQSLTLPIWVNALRRRLIRLAASWGDAAAMRDQCAITVDGDWQQAELHWRDPARYSSRQHTTMKMGGIVGHATLSKMQVAQLWPLLWPGQWTHNGKLPTMGLGRFELTPREETQ